MTTVKDVQRAQVLIERCMLHYMTFEEVQLKLHRESEVEPALTQVVWRKLQEANPRFFEHYLLRVRLKEQIAAFASLGGSPGAESSGREAIVSGMGADVSLLPPPSPSPGAS